MGKCELLTTATRNGIWHIQWRSIWQYLANLKMIISYWPVTELVDIYLRETLKHTRKHIKYFIAALFIIDKYWKQLKCASTRKWINYDILNELYSI